MPARLVEYACTACEASGLISHVCSCCTIDGVFPWFLDMLRQSCPDCGGRGIISRTCGSCHGEGKLSTRIWLPDAVEETREVLNDLEQSVNDGVGAWILVDALRLAYEHCEPSTRELLFPQPILDRLDTIVQLLPIRCSHCKGRGADSISGAKCVYCKGAGCCEEQRGRQAN
jgi:DnaJ-class molecular chaperone